MIMTLILKMIDTLFSHFLQDYDGMVKLVDDLRSVPNNKVTCTLAIKQLYAFALNR